MKIKQGNELKAKPKLYCIFDVRSQEFMRKFHSKKPQKMKWIRLREAIGADWLVIQSLTTPEAWQYHHITDVCVFKTKQKAEDVINKTMKLCEECDVEIGVLHPCEIKKISRGKYRITDDTLIYQ